ncbi:MAG TPA: phage portal protein, partial [Nannocystaceae bacterium]|nr:phage portal protein [Nannocystaceae bacterium]
SPVEECFDRLLELTISEELLMPSNHYAKFSREGLLRGDPGQRADFYSKLVALGVLTPNEIREKEDMEGIGADGDVRLRPANFVPLNAAAPAGYGNATPAAPGG